MIPSAFWFYLVMPQQSAVAWALSYCGEGRLGELVLGSETLTAGPGSATNYTQDLNTLLVLPSLSFLIHKTGTGTCSTK